MEQTRPSLGRRAAAVTISLASLLLGAAAPRAQQDPPLPPEAGGEPRPPQPSPAGAGVRAALAALDLRLTVFTDVDYVGVNGRLRNPAGEDVGDRFSLREVELDLRAKIDEQAAGVLILAVEERAPGEFEVVVEEGYATVDGLLDSFSARAGRFRTSFGVQNRLHTHDQPTIDRPLALRNFLGAEGSVEVGAELSWVAAGESTTAQVAYSLLNGENDAVLAGADAESVAHLLRASAMFDVAEASYFELGGSALFGESEPTGGDSVLLGADATFLWRPADHRDRVSALLQGEVFYLQRELAGQKLYSAGAYAMAQVQVLASTYLGGRWDWSEFATDDSRDERGASAWVSFFFSGYSRLRVGYQYLDSPLQTADHIGYVQLTTVFGSPPQLPYWVNPPSR